MSSRHLDEEKIESSFKRTKFEFKKIEQKTEKEIANERLKPAGDPNSQVCLQT